MPDKRNASALQKESNAVGDGVMEEATPEMLQIEDENSFEGGDELCGKREVFTLLGKQRDKARKNLHNAR